MGHRRSIYSFIAEPISEVIRFQSVVGTGKATYLLSRMTSSSTRNASLSSETHINRKKENQQPLKCQPILYFYFFQLHSLFFSLLLWMHFSSLLWISSDHFSMTTVVSLTDLFWVHTALLGPPENYSSRIFSRD